MASTASGRIFIGCEDNDIYEFDYASNSVPSLPISHSQSFFLQLMGYSSRGQMTNRTGYLLQLVLPSFLRELRYGENINALIVDDARQLLYCVYRHNAIYAYYLGPKGSPAGRMPSRHRVPLRVRSRRHRGRAARVPGPRQAQRHRASAERAAARQRGGRFFSFFSL